MGEHCVGAVLPGEAVDLRDRRAVDAATDSVDSEDACLVGSHAGDSGDAGHGCERGACRLEMDVDAEVALAWTT